MKNNLLKLYLSVFLTFISFLASAQPVDPPADPDPPAAPIDTNLVILAIAGIVFAYYILKSKKLYFIK
ncbi:Hypothetical transmembrane protein [Flavobacterium indicum GPTSA100-9 = DSM 17447]|uniref:Hypothetical transmembrane protein n=1 Tax=Flavobacterium indicum (strain DSM 17447 / CIP 109464 / GPTSA100-9) TaxID=1094466 RepID=H8XVM3_FLAIG|nr:hypothetical protein [Flavobacterium indicum]CCG53987.1 Hypothetical transmembrane protein [Flavobacterium indicum GPTSA100-9 = DSM 17447]